MRSEEVGVPNTLSPQGSLEIVKQYSKESTDSSDRCPHLPNPASALLQAGSSGWGFPGARRWATRPSSCPPTHLTPPTARKAAPTTHTHNKAQPRAQGPPFSFPFRCPAWPVLFNPLSFALEGSRVSFSKLVMGIRRDVGSLEVLVSFCLAKASVF